jgi:hypothetical protein
MVNIEQNGFVLKITEYGECVRQYHDSNYDRFMKISSQMITDHLQNNCLQKNQSKDEVKNTNFHIYTY